MKNTLKKTILLSTAFLMMFSLFGSVEVKAATRDYTTLAPLPGTTNTDNCVGTTCQTTLQKYLPGAFKLTVGIAAGLAFVMITFGGITYAISDSISGKEEGRKYIENALWGLLLVIGAYVILYTINPQILDLKLSIQRPKTEIAPPTILASTCEAPTCQSLNSIGLGSIATGSAVGKGVAPVLANKLVQLDEFLKDLRITWRITEAFPPSQVHKAACHMDGTCIDANVLPDPKILSAFINAAQRNGLRAIYEVETDAAKEALVRAGVRAPNILVLPPLPNGQTQITAPHFSVYNQ